MDYGKAALVLCLTIFIVVGINAAIYASLRRGTTVGQIELLRRAAGRIRNPWEDENSDLQELSRRVTELSAKQEHTNESKQDEQL